MVQKAWVSPHTDRVPHQLLQVHFPRPCDLPLLHPFTATHFRLICASKRHVFPTPFLFHRPIYPNPFTPAAATVPSLSPHCPLRGVPWRPSASLGVPSCRGNRRRKTKPLTPAGRHPVFERKGAHGKGAHGKGAHGKGRTAPRF